MVKLKYKGHLANGKTILPSGGSVEVEKGKIYNISEADAEKLLKSKYWELVKEDKEEKKVIKYKKIINKLEEDD